MFDLLCTFLQVATTAGAGSGCSRDFVWLSPHGRLSSKHPGGKLDRKQSGYELSQHSSMEWWHYKWWLKPCPHHWPLHLLFEVTCVPWNGISRSDDNRMFELGRTAVLFSLELRYFTLTLWCTRVQSSCPHGHLLPPF